MTELNKPAKLPSQDLFGLTLGNILFLPIFEPTKKANVSQIQTDKNIIIVTIKPQFSSILILIIDPSKSPSQIIPKFISDMFNNAFCSFLKISKNNDIRQVIIITYTGPLTKSKKLVKAKKNKPQDNNNLEGFAPCSFPRLHNSIPENNITIVNNEKYK